MGSTGETGSKASGRPRRLIILGATGSIGVQTIEVVRALAAEAAAAGEAAPIEIVGLAGGRDLEKLLVAAEALGVRELAIADAGPGGSGAGSTDLGAGQWHGAGSTDLRAGQWHGCNLRRGAGAAEALVREVPCDVVMGAIVGAAGLPATLAAAELGMDIALANKETLVAAGGLVVPAARASGSRLLPVDSEHSAVWQCLTGTGTGGMGGTGGMAGGAGWAPVPPMDAPSSVRRVTLTASGGPFRDWPADRIARATPAEALNHPTWDMGPKVTIDCASLMNKALELIEAHWLFGLGASKLDVLIHPQSIVHALVEHVDGSVVAQMGSPDMRAPIQYALTFPGRSPGPAPKLDLAAAGKLEFYAPDLERFPALAGAWRVMELDGGGGAGGAGGAGAVFNAANEAAVEAFCAGRVAFGRVAELALGALEALGDPAPRIGSLDDVHEVDGAARRWVERAIGAG